MNPLERVKATLQCERTDRIPVIPEVAAVTAKLRGKSVREYVSNGEVLAECQLAAQETFQYDVVIAFADLCVEAEAIGWDCYYHEGIRHYLQRAWQGGFNRRIRHECQRGHAIRIGLIPEVPVEKAVFISNAAGLAPDCICFIRMP